MEILVAGERRAEFARSVDERACHPFAFPRFFVNLLDRADNQ